MQLLANIDVDDLARAERFYCDGLGLTRGRSLGPGALEVLGAGAPIYLLEKAAGTPAFGGASGGRDYRRHWTPVHLDFVVEDLESALTRAVAAGAIAESEITTHVWGRIVLLQDPFGHGLCLLSFSARGYDALLATDTPG